MYVDFKSEEEVEEYLKNLGIEYRFGCFSEKNPEVCHLLGEYFEAIKQDIPKAHKIFKSNCDEYNYGRSCHNYGVYKLTGKGEPDQKDISAAYDYLSKGCELDVPQSCLNAGIMDVMGIKKDKEKNYEKGIEYLKKGCELGNEHSCYYLSAIYINGTKDDVIKKDMNAAFKYSEKACELGNRYACSNLSLMYKRGEGVKKDLNMAIEMKKKAIEMEEEMNSNFTLEFGRGAD